MFRSAYMSNPGLFAMIGSVPKSPRPTDGEGQPLPSAVTGSPTEAPDDHSKDMVSVRVMNAASAASRALTLTPGRVGAAGAGGQASSATSFTFTASQTQTPAESSATKPSATPSPQRPAPLHAATTATYKCACCNATASLVMQRECCCKPEELPSAARRLSAAEVSGTAQADARSSCRDPVACDDNELR